MIDKTNMQQFIEKSLPEVSLALHFDNCHNAYDVAGQMIEYAQKEVEQKNLDNAQKCFQLAENLYSEGDENIKNAIENVFVYNFSRAFFHEDRDHKMVIDVLPKTLLDLYKKQVIASHL